MIEQNNKLLEQQKILIQQQIREEQDKKKTDDSRIKEWQEQIEEINDVIAENKEKAKDAIFGEDLKSAIDNFANAQAEAWASGEDRAESAKRYRQKNDAPDGHRIHQGSNGIFRCDGEDS